jgi:opacity protein-like surface antigen
MRRFHNALCAAAFFAAVASPALAADCAQPGPAPAIPDGATATVDQMKAAHTAVQSYAQALEAIQDCDEAKIKIAPKGTKAEVLQKMRDEGNAAVDQAKALSDAYSAQVKIFKARAPAK